MGAENHAEFGAAVEGTAALVPYLEHEAATLRTITPDAVAAALGDLVDHVDRASLTGPFADWLAAALREAVRTGIWGWHDDDLAFARPWGFELASIRVAVTIWQGAHDRMVPFAHGEWLAAHVGRAIPRLLPEHGHLSIVVESFPRILDDVLAS
jgi:pimeloyl-ACP methyl ester carboxylesterase